MTSLAPGKVPHFRSTASLLVKEGVVVTILTVTLLRLEQRPKVNILSRSGQVVALYACAWVEQYIEMVFACSTAVVPNG